VALVVERRISGPVIGQVLESLREILAAAIAREVVPVQA